MNERPSSIVAPISVLMVFVLTGCASSAQPETKTSDITTNAAVAFAGQLVPQHPTDEPTPALLERLRCQRESFGKRL